MADEPRALIEPRRPRRPLRVGGSSGVLARVPRRLGRVWRRTIGRLLMLGGSSDGNTLTIFFEGSETFDAMLAAIARAERRVWLETYILEPDALGTAVLAALTAAATRGCQVRLMFDVIGSPRVDDAVLRPLREAGGVAAPYNPPFAFRDRRSPLQRDHRKILIVDERGFCGGMNVSVDYGSFHRGNGRFRDTHALLEGPCVADLASIFQQGWHEETGERLPAIERSAPLAEGVFVQVLRSDASRQMRHIQRALYQTVGRCLRNCFLTTPYFVPPPRLLSALVQAAKRGVDVRVLTAGLSDVPIVSVAARHLYGRLLRGGVRVYEMTERTLHAKTATIDGLYSSVGSFNLDRWSFERNLEVNVSVVDPGLARQLQERFVKDVEGSREVRLADWTARGWLESVRGWIAYQLMRL
jgi:cardiolipin synthase